MGMGLRFRKGDMVAIVAVLLLTGLVFAMFLPGQTASGAVAEIYQNGKLLKTVSLAEDQEFTVEGAYRNTVTVRDGQIAVTASDCPGQDCLHCGFTGTAGKSIVCLPNGLEIRVVGRSGDVDFVVR